MKRKERTLLMTDNCACHLVGASLPFSDDDDVFSKNAADATLDAECGENLR